MLRPFGKTRRMIVSGSGTIAGVVYISKTGDTLTAGAPAAANSPIILGEGTDFIYYGAKVGQNANASIKTSYLLRKNSINNLP